MLGHVDGRASGESGMRWNANPQSVALHVASSFTRWVSGVVCGLSVCLCFAAPTSIDDACLVFCQEGSVKTR